MSVNAKHPYCIRLDELEIGEHLYDFQIDDAYIHAIEKSELLGGNVAVKARLDIRPTDFTCSISCQGVVQVTCDRCLDPMDLTIDTSDEDVETDEDAKELDLCWLAYELIVVSLPLVHSHQEGGCNPEMDALLQSHLIHRLDEDTK